MVARGVRREELDVKRLARTLLQQVRDQLRAEAEPVDVRTEPGAAS